MKIVMRKNREQLRADAIAQLLAEQPQAKTPAASTPKPVATVTPKRKIRVTYRDPSMTGQAQRMLAKLPATHRKRFELGTPLPVGKPKQSDMMKQANATLANVPSAG